MCADHAVSTPTMAQNGGAGTVAKKHAGVAVGPISNRCQLLGPDHKNRVVRMRGDELLRNFNTEKKPGARSGNIEASGVGCTDLFLNETGRSRKEHIWSGRGNKDEIDFSGRNFRLFDRL